MEGYLQTFLGIGVSVVLFILGYKQTYGARRERMKSANADIQNTLLKRIILEEINPTKETIKRIIEGKARDYRVQMKDLLSPEQIANSIYTKIFESDLITKEQREENLERLIPLFEVADKPRITERELDIDTESKTKRYWLMLIMAVITSIIGTLAVSFNEIINLDSKYDLTVLIPVLLGSLVVILTVLVFQRVKESSESSEITISGTVKRGIDFEREVATTLRKSGINYYIPTGRDIGYDFGFDKNGKKIIIEVKAWQKRPPISYLKRTISFMEESLIKQDASEAILLIKERFGFIKNQFENDKIKVMTLKEFKNYLIHK